MNWNLQANGKALDTPLGITIELEGVAREIVTCGGLGIVLFARSSDVIAFAENGDVCWRYKPHQGYRLPFTDGWCEPEGVRLYNREGFAVTLDLATGERLWFEQTK